MAAAKILAYIRTDKPGVLAVVGPSGCGKRHAIMEAARQAGVVVTHHDLAQGAVAWGRLGSQQLTADGLARCVHVISNASEQFLKGHKPFAETHAKILLMADDAGPTMRASGMPIATMRAPTADAMAKQLFMEEDWPAELAVAAARAAKGDWHQLRARKQLCPDQVAPRECSGKDASIANAAPCIVANRLLNGTAPESCPLDQSVVAWTERNLGMHCEAIEEMAMRQEAMAASTGPHAGDAVGEELFRQAAGLSAKRAQYLPGLYTNPYQKDESSARAAPRNARAAAQETSSGGRIA